MRARLTPCRKAMLELRRPYMPNDVRFALLPTLTSKPITFPKLDQLCRRIHRERRGAPLQLKDQKVHLYGDGPEGRRMVGVYTLSDSSTPSGFLGWAWADGASWRALQAALFEVEPNTAVRAEAA